MKKFYLALAIALIFSIFSNTSYAIDRDVQDNKGVFSFVLENDLFTGSDNGYTNGFRLSYLSPETTVPNFIRKTADMLPFFPEGGNERYSFSFGQKMYTPDDISAYNLIQDDQPYAGLLFGSFGMISDTGDRLDNLQITLGMVGEASLAEQAQEFVHSARKLPMPKGWQNQLKDEPVAMLSYERKWKNLYEFSPFGLGVDATPHLGFSAGNLMSYASTGVMFRLGYDLPSDYGPPLIRPSLPGSDFFQPRKKLGWYFFGGVEGRAVANNIFLDGNTFKDSHSVDKEHFVGSIQAGLALTYGNARIAYTHIMRTKEFKEQEQNNEYGAITLSLRF